MCGPKRHWCKSGRASPAEIHTKVNSCQRDNIAVSLDIWHGKSCSCSLTLIVALDQFLHGQSSIQRKLSSCVLLLHFLSFSRWFFCHSVLLRLLPASPAGSITIIMGRAQPAAKIGPAVRQLPLGRGSLLGNMAKNGAISHWPKIGG